MNTLTTAWISILYLIAVYFCFKLSKETNHERYWLALALGFLIFASHHWMEIPVMMGLLSERAHDIIEIFSSMIGALLVAYSSYGLYSSMKKVKRKVE